MLDSVTIEGLYKVKQGTKAALRRQYALTLFGLPAMHLFRGSAVLVMLIAKAIQACDSQVTGFVQPGSMNQAMAELPFTYPFAHGPSQNPVPCVQCAGSASTCKQAS